MGGIEVQDKIDLPRRLERVIQIYGDQSEAVISDWKEAWKEAHVNNNRLQCYVL